MSLTKVTHAMIVGEPAYAADYGLSATNTAVQNNTAITNAFAANDVVVFPAGTFLYSVDIELDGGKQIIGEGSSATVLEYTGTTDGVLVTNGANKIFGMTIKSSNAAETGIHLLGAGPNYFQDVYVTNNPPIGWHLESVDTSAQTIWNVFNNCGCNNAEVAVILEASGSGNVGGNTWYDGIYRTSGNANSVCYLNGGGAGTYGNTWINGDWSGYTGNTSFTIDGPSSTQNTWIGVNIDTGTTKGFVLGSGTSTNKIIGGAIQATTPVEQNNSGSSETDTILISSLTYIPSINQPSYTAPSLLNSWTNLGGSEEVAGYYKDSCGVVRIKGTLAGGTTTAATNLFVLPAGYRPLATQRFAVDSNGSYASIAVAANGAVYIVTCPSSTSLSIDVSFRAQQ